MESAHGLVSLIEVIARFEHIAKAEKLFADRKTFLTYVLDFYAALSLEYKRGRLKPHSVFGGTLNDFINPTDSETNRDGLSYVDPTAILRAALACDAAEGTSNPRYRAMQQAIAKSYNFSEAQKSHVLRSCIQLSRRLMELGPAPEVTAPAVDLTTAETETLEPQT
ncbi:MAG: hypothetical protein U9N14_02485 [Pseudomonadota bacterium]|nr:hypothetical protein [Pseudomonadota bacterium]